MSLLLLLRPSKYIPATPVDPGPPLGPGFIGGVDGSNLVPLKPKKKRKKIKETVEELSEELPELQEYLVELAEIAPELLMVLLPETLEVPGAAERLAFLHNIEQAALNLLKQEQDAYLNRLEIEQRVAMELELEAIRDRIDESENEELLILLLHKLH